MTSALFYQKEVFMKEVHECVFFVIWHFEIMANGLHRKQLVACVMQDLHF